MNSEPYHKEIPMKWIEARLGEYQCEHGVGHPGINRIMAIAKMQIFTSDKIIDGAFCKRQLEVCAIHGCDGCCSRDDFPGKISSEKYVDAVTELMRFYKNRKEKQG